LRGRFAEPSQDGAPLFIAAQPVTVMASKKLVITRHLIEQVLLRLIGRMLVFLLWG